MFEKVLKEKREKLENSLENTKPKMSSDFIVFDNFRPVIVGDEDEDSFIESFGITEERSKVLIDLMQKEIRLTKNKTISKTIVECCEKAVHPNEVVYIAYVMGQSVNNRDF